MRKSSQSPLMRCATILPTMTELSEFVTGMANRPSPLLTVYSTERVELNGAVVARWFAKIANLVGNELGADLFSGADPAGSPGAFRIRHELWAQLVWSIPLRAMGWSPLGPEDEPGASDLLLTAVIDEAGLEALGAGAWVLAQSREYLSFSWTGSPLPDGALDALAETMAQSDALEVTPPPSAPALEEIARACGSADAPVSAPRGARLGVDGDSGAASTRAGRRLIAVDRSEGPSAPPQVIGECLRAWLEGASVVLVDSALFGPEEIARIAEAEGAAPA